MKWLKRILDRSTPLSDFHWESAKWETCAIGEAIENEIHVEVSPGRNSTPEDSRLNKMGRDFHNAVTMDRRSAALRHYLAIQKRLAALSKVR